MRSATLERGQSRFVQPDSYSNGRTQQGENEFALFFAGTGGVGDKLGALNSRLSKIYPKKKDGTNNFQAYDAVFFSKPHSKDKLRSASHLIIDKINEGKHIRIYGHSMGGTEAVVAVKGTEKIDPEFLKKHAKDIDLELNTPTTFIKNFIQGSIYLARFGKILVNEMARTPYKSGFYRGLVSLMTLPPSKEIIDQITLKSGLRTAFAKKSNYDSSRLEHEYKLDRDYLSLIEPEVRDKVNTLDHRLADFMSDPKKNRKEIKKVIKQRAKLTNIPIEDIYAMKYADHFGDKPLETPQYQRTFKGMVDKVRLFSKTFVTGKIHRLYRDLLKKGVKSIVAIPDFDMVFKRKHAPDAVNIHGTHTAPLAVQPNALGSQREYALAA